jgi:hypothetical protein
MKPIKVRIDEIDPSGNVESFWYGALLEFLPGDAECVANAVVMRKDDGVLRIVCMGSFAEITVLGRGDYENDI